MLYPSNHRINQDASWADGGSISPLSAVIAPGLILAALVANQPLLNDPNPRNLHPMIYHINLILAHVILFFNNLFFRKRIFLGSFELYVEPMADLWAADRWAVR